MHGKNIRFFFLCTRETNPIERTEIFNNLIVEFKVHYLSLICCYLFCFIGDLNQEDMSQFDHTTLKTHCQV